MLSERKGRAWNFARLAKLFLLSFLCFLIRSTIWPKLCFHVRQWVLHPILNTLKLSIKKDAPPILFSIRKNILQYNSTSLSKNQEKANNGPSYRFAAINKHN